MTLKSDFYYDAFVLNIVDGDTIDVTIDLGFSIFHTTRLRLYGIDTKELTSKDGGDRILANKAKQYLIDNILNRTFEIKTYKQDKYGRYLADIFVDGYDGSTINGKMIVEELAVPYYGGARI